MYRCLIIDDEPRIGQGLQKLIDWSAYGFAMPDCVCHGEEALELHEMDPYDLIITDIRMPDIDGLSLVKHIRSYDKTTFLLVISGYSDFEYARTALRYQVTGYLLKPIDEVLLEEYCTQIQMELQARTQRQLAQWKLQVALLSSCMNHWIMRRPVDPAEFINVISQTTFPFVMTFFLLKERACNVEGSAKLSSAYRLPVFPFHLPNYGDGLCALLSIADEQYARETEAFCRAVQRQLQRVCRVVVSPPIYSWEDFSEKTRYALQFLYQATGAEELGIVYLRPGAGNRHSIDAVINYVNENFSSTISLKLLASHFYLNEAYLGRLFKQATGQKFTDYLNFLRIQRAIQLLKNPNVKVQEACYQVGYQDIAYFYKKFREQTGHSPSEFR